MAPSDTGSGPSQRRFDAAPGASHGWGRTAAAEACVLHRDSDNFGLSLRHAKCVSQGGGLNGSSAATSSKPHGSGSSIAEGRGHQGAGAAPDMGRLGNAVPR